MVRRILKNHFLKTKLKAKAKRSFAWMMTAVMVAGVSGFAAKTIDVNADTYTPIYLDVADHTQEEIYGFMQAHPVNLTRAETYATAPSLSEPYDAGELSGESKQNAFNMLNQFRYVAGLGADVKENPTYQKYSESGALLTALYYAQTHTLSHSPSRPTCISDSKYDQLYKDGYIGCNQANLGFGHVNLPAVIKSWVGDSDASNIDRVGHRRWILSPKLEETGFGFVNKASSMYSFSGNAGSSTITTVAWPAKNTPTSFFNKSDAWSVSFQKTISASSISVKLVRKSDNKTWNFSSAAADGAFYVNNQGFGSLRNCVIFRPNDLQTIEEDDVFTVTVNNTADQTQLTYNVNFFNVTAASGTDANGNKWELDGSGTLTITGSNKMVDYTTPSLAPWYSVRKSVKKIVIDGPTHIGQFAFADMANLVDFQIGSSVVSCGQQIFPYATNLKTLRIPATLKDLDLGLVNHNLSTIIFEGNPPDIYGKSGFQQETDTPITAYYLGSNTKWTKDNMINYGAKDVTWVSYCSLAADGSVKAHSFTSHVVKPGCETKGYTEYACKNCTYSYQDLEVEATGHSYSAPNFVWSNDYSACSAFKKCRNCEHTVSGEATVEILNDVAATCESQGVTEYRAMVTLDGKPYSSLYTVTSDPLGHNYLPIEIVWSEDYKTASAQRVCANGCGEDSTYPCKVSKTEILPSCSEDGSMVYTAKVDIDGETYTDTKTVVLSKYAHQYKNGICQECNDLFEVVIDGLIYTVVLDETSTPDCPVAMLTTTIGEDGKEKDALMMSVKADAEELTQTGTKIAVVKDVIPSDEVDLPYVVAEVAEEGFSGTTLDSVILPATLEKVNANAFKDSTITKVAFLNKLAPTLDPDAFANSKVTTVTIPIGASGYERQDALVSMKDVIKIMEVASPTYPGQKPSTGTDDGTGTGNGTGTNTTITPGTTTPDVPTGIASKPNGTKVTYKKCKYEVVNDSTNPFAVVFVGPTSKKVKTITIPAYIVIDNIRYNVIGIKANAFKGCKKLKIIKSKSKKLKKAKIAKKAFKGLKKKVKVKVPKSKLKTYKKWFKKKSLPKKVKISKL